MPRRLLFLALTLSLATAGVAQDRAIAGLNQAVAFLEARFAADPRDFTAANQLSTRLLHRARLTGRIDDYRRADAIAALSLKAMGGELNAGALAASVQTRMALHRFADARDFAQQLEKLDPGRANAPQLLGDALLELGDLGGAQVAFTEMLARADPDAGSEWRASRLAWLRGQLEDAVQHLDRAVTFARAEDDREALAWILVQRGELAFRRGQHDAAEELYSEAQDRVPDWNATVHLAELRGAQGKDQQAAELFENAAKATGRPEVWQALGDLHSFYKHSEAAKAAYDRALAGYRDSLERGEVLYVHHLVSFFSDSEPDPKRAVELARQDLEQRKTAAAWDALAWALYRSGDFDGARSACAEALATGIRDSHILYHAGTIHLSAGDVAAGQRLLRQAAETNPHFAGFHIHQ